MYGRTTPRIASRPPQIPPIPEIRDLYNIPPEARYVPCPPPGFGGSPPHMGNGSVRHSSSHNMLNSATSPTNTSFQANGRLITANGPLSPGRASILSTFVPHPSPMNMEHEGHLV